MLNFHDPVKAQGFAESYARLFEGVVDEAIGDVIEGVPYWEAFARARRKYDAMRREYFSRRFQCSDSAFREHGPDRVFADLYKRLFPPVQ